MEGYSVTEAASVLGVPTERVWELLARGVLSGAPEGETGMRVFLQPRPAPAPPQPARPNGNGGEDPQRELSPFRELLTEFRSLTERYGQALLALGEARGEVASLRSRVDMLEARIDLRLPPGGATGPATGWTQPMPWSAPRAEPEPPAPAASPSSVPAADAEPRSPAPAAMDPGAPAEPRTVRRDSPRRATESFAEALARAQDPSPPELPGGPEASAALAALRGTTAEDANPPDAALPRELPPAEAVPVADELPVADETVGAQEPAREVQEAAPESVTEVAPGEATVVEESAMADEPPPAEEPEPEPGARTERSDGGPAWQDERYTAEIGEPDWWEAEAFPAAPTPAEPEAGDDAADGVAAPAAETTEPEAAEPEAPEPQAAEPEAPEPQAAEPKAAEPEGAGRVTAGPSAPATGGLTRLRRAPAPPDEETVLWFGRSPEPNPPAPGSVGSTDDVDVEGGAGEMEIAPTGGGDAAPNRTPGPLDDALAALEELSRATPPPPRAPGPDRPGVHDRLEPGWTDPVIERAPRQSATPAGRAYRRLRRILPG